MYTPKKTIYNEDMSVYCVSYRIFYSVVFKYVAHYRLSVIFIGKLRCNQLMSKRLISGFCVDKLIFFVEVVNAATIYERRESLCLFERIIMQKSFTFSYSWVRSVLICHLGSSKNTNCLFVKCRSLCIFHKYFIVILLFYVSKLLLNVGFEV